jgi:hypothetical protein
MGLQNLIAMNIITFTDIIYLILKIGDDWNLEDLESTDFPPVPSDAKALLCKNCYLFIGQKKKPLLSLAAGVNYGATKYLPELSYFAALMCNCVNPYAHIFKLSFGKGQIGTSGHCIAFENNLREQIETLRIHTQTELPQIPGRDFVFNFVYYGPLDKWERLVQRTEAFPQGELMSLFGKLISVPWGALSIVIGFLTRAYPNKWKQSESIKSQEDCDRIVQDLIDNVKIEKEDSIANKIHIQIEQDEVPPLPAGETNIKESTMIDGNVEISFVTTKDTPLEEATVNDRLDLFNSVKDHLEPLLRPNTDTDLNPVDPLKVTYYHPPINEYTHMHEILEGFFPLLFPWGCPFQNTVQPFQLQHMLNQASNRFTNQSLFIIYMFNHFMRRKHAQAAKYTFLKDKATLERLSESIRDPNFMEHIERAISDPESEFAKALESAFSFLMVRMASTLNFSPGTGRNAVAQMLALRRFFSDGGLFLTIAPQSNYCIFYRLLFGLKNNNYISSSAENNNFNG